MSSILNYFIFYIQYMPKSANTASTLNDNSILKNCNKKVTGMILYFD